MNETKELSAAEGERLNAELIRQGQERLRQANELTRTSAETAREVAESRRVTAASEVGKTVAELTALLERMEAVETMRRTSHGQEGRVTAIDAVPRSRARDGL